MREKARRLRRRYGRSRSRSMTYGVLPPYKEFLAAIRENNPDEDRPYLAPGQKYPMELVGMDVRVADKIGLEPSGVGDYGKPRYELTEKQLYAMLKKLVRVFDSNMKDEAMREAAGDLASSVMTTLGFEWI
jgi:hypothetical protein